MATPTDPSSPRPEALRLFVVDGAAQGQSRRRRKGTNTTRRKSDQQLSLFFSPTQLVFEFHSRFGLTIGAGPCLPADDLCTLRLDLIEEEVAELRDALISRSLISTVDALADIVYVTYGAAICFGVDLDAALEEVHRSNLTKLGPDGEVMYRPDGKVLKGPDYEPPDIAGVVDAMRQASKRSGHKHVPCTPSGPDVTTLEAG